jgi:hypothetical protein
MNAEDINGNIRNSGLFVAKLRMDYGAKKMKTAPFPVFIPTAPVNLQVNQDLMEHVVMASVSIDGKFLEIVSYVSNGVIIDSPGSKSRYPVEEVESMAIELRIPDAEGKCTCKVCSPPKEAKEMPDEEDEEEE